MTTTHYERALLFQSLRPHTFTALQKLVMAMADYQNNRGKVGWFDRDKGLRAYKKFESNLRDTLVAIVIDGAIRRDEPASKYRTRLLEDIEGFSIAFPNWQDAYLFAHEYFVVHASTAETRIAELLRAPS